MIVHDPQTGRWIDTSTGRYYDPGNPAQSTLQPSDVLRQAMNRAWTGDPEAMGVAGALVARYNASQQAPSPAAPVPAQPSSPAGAGGMSGWRMTPEQLNAVTAQIRTVLDERTSRDQLDIQERSLRQRMAERGQNPEWWFSQYGQLPYTSHHPGTTEEDVYGGQSPAYTNAQTASVREAWRGQHIGRAEALQRVSEALARHLEGADWLTKYGELQRSIRQGQAQLDDETARLSSDPEKDKLLIVPSSGGMWRHGAAGVARADELAEMRRQADEMLRARYPEQQAAIDRQRLANPETVRFQQPHVLAAAGLDPYLSEQTSRPRAYGTGGLIEYFASGGASGTAPGGPYPYPEPVSPEELELQARHGADEADIQSQLADLQAETAQRLQGMDAEHAQAMAALQQDLNQKAEHYAQRYAALQNAYAAAVQTGMYRGMVQSGASWAG